MRQIFVVVLVLMVGSLLFVGCDQKQMTEQITKLTAENDSLKTELMKTTAQVESLNAQLAEMTKVEETVEAEKVATPEKAKAETKGAPAPKKTKTIK